MKIKFLGALGSVTGSCTLLNHGGRYYLVDCGTWQGSASNVYEPDGRLFRFKPNAIAAVFLTHAHMDHCGRLPLLAKHGFNGPIYCTRATAKLARLALLDAANLSGSQFGSDDVARLKFKCFDDDPRFQFGRFTGLDANLSVAIIRTSHILGAVGFEFQFAEPSSCGSRPRRTIVFSGDLGNNQDHHCYQALLNGRQYPSTHVGYVVCESTYGASNRDLVFTSYAERIAALDCVLTDAAAAGSPTTVVFPCFSLQRTQELIVDLHCLLSKRKSGVFTKLASRGDANSIPRQIEVMVDSPLAQKYGQIFAEELRRIRPSGKPYYLNPELPSRLGLTNGACLDLLDRLFGVRGATQMFDRYSLNYEQSWSHVQAPPLRIIIAGAGMCTGGRVVGHLKRLLPVPSCTVVLTGYQGEGTPGAELAKRARDSGAPVNIADWGIYNSQVRARIVELSGFYSGHADCTGLLDYLFHKNSEHEYSSVKRVFLNHGEQSAREGLERAIKIRASEWRCDDRVIDGVELPQSAGAWFDLLLDRWVREWHPVVEPPEEAFAIGMNLLALVEATIGTPAGTKSSLTTQNSLVEELRAMKAILQQIRGEYARVIS
ncbi:MAG: MBL fold metallo-hydrolase [Acidobacteriia bacterium]|nr:MBL fold metallo-hydrolase [Terriglobia bacterium]